MTWLKDSNGNRCSVEYFGSREAAQQALDSLKDCSNCLDSSGCWGCFDCVGCSRCAGCADLKNARPVKQNASATDPEISSVVPRVENLHQKVYAAVSQPGALDMNDWHTCETTHCRAGSVVHLAGEAGAKLEQFYDTELAAMLIYRESCNGFRINPCRFYDSNEEALEDMRKLAEEEAAV